MTKEADQWVKHASCRRHPGDWWFEDVGQFRQLAQSICVNECPVSSECLLAALSAEGSTPARMRWGIWGGATPPQRDAMWRRGWRGHGAELERPASGDPPEGVAA